MNNKCNYKSFHQKDNTVFDYVYISMSDTTMFNGMGETQLKWMLQDLGYPLFGIFNPEPNYDVFAYCRYYDAITNRTAFGWRIIGGIE
jgi:hypothetical protein